VKESLLTVSASRKEDDKEGERRFLYRGIATRSFERQFQLADYVKVVDARLQDGLLHIELVREIPEAMKPRQIEIRSDGGRYIQGQTDDKTVEKAA
jgi:molecular chaperone IbpA